MPKIVKVVSYATQLQKDGFPADGSRHSKGQKSNANADSENWATAYHDDISPSDSASQIAVRSQTQVAQVKEPRSTTALTHASLRKSSGHSQCEAVQALIKKPDSVNFLDYDANIEKTATIEIQPKAENHQKVTTVRTSKAPPPAVTSASEDSACDVQCVQRNMTRVHISYRRRTATQDASKPVSMPLRLDQKSAVKSVRSVKSSQHQPSQAESRLQAPGSKVITTELRFEDASVSRRSGKMSSLHNTTKMSDSHKSAVSAHQTHHAQSSVTEEIPAPLSDMPDTTYVQNIVAEDEAPSNVMSWCLDEHVSPSALWCVPDNATHILPPERLFSMSTARTQSEHHTEHVSRTRSKTARVSTVNWGEPMYEESIKADALPTLGSHESGLLLVESKSNTVTERSEASAQPSITWSKASAPRSTMTKQHPSIKFRDAVGRRFTFPLSVCNTWKVIITLDRVDLWLTLQGMHDLICEAFVHVDILGYHAKEGHFDLVDNDGEIILPSVWELVIKQDMEIAMSLWPMPELGQTWPAMLYCKPVDMQTVPVAQPVMQQPATAQPTTEQPTPAVQHNVTIRDDSSVKSAMIVPSDTVSCKSSSNGASAIPSHKHSVKDKSSQVEHSQKASIKGSTHEIVIEIDQVERASSKGARSMQSSRKAADGEKAATVKGTFAKAASARASSARAPSAKIPPIVLELEAPSVAHSKLTSCKESHHGGATALLEVPVTKSVKTRSSKHSASPVVPLVADIAENIDVAVETPSNKVLEASQSFSSKRKRSAEPTDKQDGGNKSTKNKTVAASGKTKQSSLQQSKAPSKQGSAQVVEAEIELQAGNGEISARGTAANADSEHISVEIRADDTKKANVKVRRSERPALPPMTAWVLGNCNYRV